MCGVVAVLGKRNASQFVVEGLKKLEYRGYDSAGIALASHGTLQTIKSEGKLFNLIDYTTYFGFYRLLELGVVRAGNALQEVCVCVRVRVSGKLRWVCLGGACFVK